MKKSYQISKINNKRNYNRILLHIRKQESVVNVNILKDKDILHIETSKDIIDLDVKLLKIFHEYEKNAQLKELEQTEVYRKVLLLKGLDCGHCAGRIESLAKKSFDHERIVVDFSTERFIIETKNKELYDNILTEVARICYKVDPRINVSNISTKRRNVDLEENKISKVKLSMFIIGSLIAIVYVISKCIILDDIIWFFHSSNEHLLNPIEYVTLIVALFLVGYQVIIDFFINIFKRRELDEKVLMTLASIGAVVTNHAIEAVSVMIFYQIGKLLQDKAINVSRKSIKALLSFEVQHARLKVDEEEMLVNVESVMPGDILIIKTGEMIPIDGVVVLGKSYLDVKALTGEAVYQNIKPNDNVRSGSINLGNVITVKAKKVYRDSTMSQILDMVENASAAKAKTENFITKFAKIYTPCVVAIACFVSFILPIVIALIKGDLSLIKPLMLGSNHDNGYIYTGMVFLVIACPCALVISIPLAYFNGIGLASKEGILIKGSNYLEALSNTKTFMFDKTGTLTKGEFGLLDIVVVDEEYKKEDILKLMAYCEFHSTHPIGISIVDAYGRENIFSEVIEDFTVLPGRGVRAYINGARIVVCNYKLLVENKIDFSNIQNPYLVLYVLKEKKVIGYALIGDSLKSDASKTLKKLKKQNITNISMLTGDNIDVAKNIGILVGCDNVYAELYPQDKVRILEEEKQKLPKNKKIAYVGDGINDAPVISSSDVGIALGASASEGSIAIADIVVMSNSLSKLNDALLISRITKKIVIQNTIISLFIKFFVFLLNFLHLPTMIWLAIFSDVGVSLLAIINSIRITHRYKVIKKKEVKDE